MADLLRVRCTWGGGGVVGPGVSTFYFTAAHTGFNADLVALWTAVQGRLPSIAHVTVPGSGDVIDSATGDLTGGWTDGTDTQVSGTATNQCPQGVGLRIVWLTNGFSGGRRVRGSTFVVPLDATMYSTLGTLSASRAQFVTAAAAFVTASAGAHVIWTRPVNGAGGGFSSVTGSSIPDKISTLRSRRV